MESVTMQEFNKQAGKALIILLLFIGFSVYRILKDINRLEYIGVLSVSILGLIAIRRLIIIVEKIAINGSVKIKSMESLFLQQILILGLGILSIYVFVAKGAYGTYLLFQDFSIKMLVYRILILFISYQLVVAVNKMQTVLKAIQANKNNSFIKGE